VVQQSNNQKVRPAVSLPLLVDYASLFSVLLLALLLSDSSPRLLSCPPSSVIVSTSAIDVLAKG